MTECRIKGCRYLQTTCLTCGRVICTKTLPTHEWISIKDKLPKKDEHVLVYGDDGVFRAYCDEDTQYPSWQCYPIGSYAGDGCVYGITHWMPLPASP